MTQLPREDDSPFSLPRDTPEVMPIDYPSLDSDVDFQEAYDEGLDDVIDSEPYRTDDDPIKSAKRLMREGVGGREYYTFSHDRIQRWARYRYGHPARVAVESSDIDRGGLYIKFEDDEPDIELIPIKWRAFFKIFEKHKLAFIFRTRTRSGAQSKFYRFIERDDVNRVSAAKRLR